MRQIPFLVRIAALLGLLSLAAATGFADAHESVDGAHVGIRIYEGVDPADMDEIYRAATEGFLPVLSASEGFIAYVLLSEGSALAAINIFESVEQADAANAAAADFVAGFIAPLLPNPPTVTLGALEIFHIASLHDADMDEDMPDASASADEEAGDMDDGDEHGMEGMDDGIGALYGSLRVYSGYDASQHAENMELTRSMFLPLQQSMEGYFGYMLMYDGDEAIAALSIFDSQENADAANEEAADFIAENMADFLTDDPASVTGGLGIAALAELHMGANLVDMADMDAEAHGMEEDSDHEQEHGDDADEDQDHEHDDDDHERDDTDD